MRKWWSKGAAVGSAEGKRGAQAAARLDEDLENLERGLGLKHADVEEWVRRQVPEAAHGRHPGDEFESRRAHRSVERAGTAVSGFFGLFGRKKLNIKSQARNSTVHQASCVSDCQIEFTCGNEKGASGQAQFRVTNARGEQRSGADSFSTKSFKNMLKGAGVQGRKGEDDPKRGGREKPTKAEVAQMVKYLGIDTRDKSFYWIAEEALGAILPAGWEEHRTDEDCVYYYNAVTRESTWEHPLDGYFRFIYRKLRRMKKYNKNGKGKDTVEQRQRDRELVDVLWHMDQEHKKGETLKREPGAGSSDGASQTESSYSLSHSGLDSSYDEARSISGRSNASSSLGGASSRADHSYLSHVPYESVPSEVKEIAQYLGIDLNALDAPVSVDEVREMGQYLGIDVVSEGYLLPLARIALQAPLPKGWEICKDEEGEPFYYERKTGTTSYRHPADEYFINKVLEDRTRHVKAVQEGAAVRLSEPWLDFMEANGSRYWYNFRTGQRTASAPLGVHAQHGALLADDTSDRTGPSRTHSTHSGSFDPRWAPKLTPSAETREMKRNTCPEREGVLGEFLSDENVLDSVEEGLAAGDTRQEQFQHPQPSLLPTNPLTSQAAEPPWEQARQLSASPASLTASSLAPSPGVKTAAHMQGRFAAPPPPAGMPGGYVRHKLGAGTEVGGVDAAIEARVKAAAARNA